MGRKFGHILSSVFRQRCDVYLTIILRWVIGRALAAASDVCVEVASQCLRVQTTRLSIPWLPDMPCHRHLASVW